RLPRRGRVVPPQHLGAAVADVHARDRAVALEEPVRAQRGLELCERRELDGHPQTARAACRSQSRPSSRSATGTRSSAEWMSVAATSADIVRSGKKPYA